MAWNIRARKTEHAGAKHGNGAYWGLKAIAKHASNKERRVNARRAVASALGEVAPTDTASGGVDVGGVTRFAAESRMEIVSDQSSHGFGRRVRRNTRRWCRGKVGRLHQFVLQKTVGETFGLPALHVWACACCGRKAYNLKTHWLNDLQEAVQ